MRRSPKSPLIVTYQNGILTVDLFIAYNAKAFSRKRNEAISQSSDGKERASQSPSAADLIERGIRNGWSGKYPFTPLMKQMIGEVFPGSSCENDDFLTVDIKLSRHHRKNMPKLAVLSNWLQGKRRPVPIYYMYSPMPAHVASAMWRRFWGIFRTGQLESIGFNWSPNFPGYMVMPTRYTDGQILRTAPHEAGHLFGLGDAYDAWYRFYYYAPGTEEYMMRHNRKVHPEEIEMLLKAQRYGKMQNFPRKFKFKNILAGWQRAFTGMFRKRHR